MENEINAALLEAEYYRLVDLVEALEAMDDFDIAEEVWEEAKMIKVQWEKAERRIG